MLLSGMNADRTLMIVHDWLWRLIAVCSVVMIAGVFLSAVILLAELASWICA